MPEEQLPNNISEQQLNFGYWLVTHKLQIKKILIAIFIAFDAVLVVWNAWNWVDFYLFNEKEYRQMIAESAAALKAGAGEKMPSSLLIANAQVFSANGKYDFIAQIKNPESDYRADFTYRFTGNGVATEPRSGFVLPSDDKYLVVIGQVLQKTPTAPVLEINDLRWTRVNRHVINDYAKFSADRLNFKMEEMRFVPADATPTPGTGGVAVDGNLPTGSTHFVFMNATGFGYKAIRFIALLYRGPELVAVNTQVVTDILPGETRTIEIPWYQPLPAISDTRIFPEVDIMRDAVYLR